MTTTQNGFLTPSGNRWCAACDREHGRSFICGSYASDIVALINAEEELRDMVLLPYGIPGDGISQLLAPVVQIPEAERLYMQGGRNRDTEPTPHWLRDLYSRKAVSR